MKPIIACGTSEGENIYEGNFGNSPHFHIFEMNARGFEFKEEIDNFSLEESEDRESTEELKANNISSLLKSKSVNVLLVHQMDPEIAKISKSFVPIISHELNIERALNSVKEKLHLVEREWRKGENREYLILEES